MAATAMLFRGLSAAASLKHRLGEGGGKHIAALPRPQRRGLIEAGGHYAHVFSSGALFRGLSAAASLKRGLQAWRANHPCQLFRGLSAAASLKPAYPPPTRSRSATSSAASAPRPH